MSAYDYWDPETGEGLSDDDLHERFDDMLDEIGGEIVVFGITFDASRVLKEMDPIAYRVSYSDWLNNQEDGGVITSDEPLRVQYCDEGQDITGDLYASESATEVRAWAGDDVHAVAIRHGDDAWRDESTDKAYDSWQEVFEAAGIDVDRLV